MQDWNFMVSIHLSNIFRIIKHSQSHKWNAKIYIVPGYVQNKAVIQTEISEAFINSEFVNGSRADRLNYNPIILWVHILLLKTLPF